MPPPRFSHWLMFPWIKFPHFLGNFRVHKYISTCSTPRSGSVPSKSHGVAIEAAATGKSYWRHDDHIFPTKAFMWQSFCATETFFLFPKFSFCLEMKAQPVLPRRGCFLHSLWEMFTKPLHDWLAGWLNLACFCPFCFKGGGGIPVAEDAGRVADQPWYTYVTANTYMGSRKPYRSKAI